MNNKDFIKKLIFCENLSKYIIPLCFNVIFFSILKLTNNSNTTTLEDGYVYKVVENIGVIEGMDENIDIEYLENNDLLSSYQTIDIFESDSFKATPKYIEQDIELEVYEYVETNRLVANKSYLETGGYIIEFKNEEINNLEKVGYKVVGVTTLSDDNIEDLDYVIIRKPVYEIEENDRVITFKYEEFMYVSNIFDEYKIIDYDYEIVSRDDLENYELDKNFTKVKK